MANKYSPEEIVSSIFKKFENQWLTPEFIREESNRVSDALSDFRVGDPGRTSRNFADRNCIQRDNPTKASAYQYSRISCKDETFFSIINVYDVPEFDDDKYKALIHLDSLRTEIAKKPINLESLKTKIKSQQNSSFTPSQIIYYGVPGCGKSKKVQDTIANVEEYNKVRVVFHPEYSSADFIGQIFPCVCEDGHGVDYRFKAGPFSEILRRAYLNPQQQFYLVIEEINRGNAAAIFSDVFQLLDRLKKGNSDSVGGNTYTAGWSQYFVDNADINGYIRKESAFLNEISDENRELIHRGVAPSSDKDSAKCYKSIKITDCNGCEINFTANTAIRLPPNLSIFATMNTSDQNVFTLDNAFKRRFDSELIKNTLAGDEHKVQRETKIEGTSVTWGEFWGKINNLILEKNASMTSTEDKRLGAYFIVGDEKTDAAGNKYREVSKKLFGEKVLEYLWNDAFKFKHKDIFKEDCKSVESLIDNFEKGGFAAVFKNDEFTAAAVQELKASDN